MSLSYVDSGIILRTPAGRQSHCFASSRQHWFCSP